MDPNTLALHCLMFDLHHLTGRTPKLKQIELEDTFLSEMTSPVGIALSTQQKCSISSGAPKYHKLPVFRRCRSQLYPGDPGE